MAAALRDRGARAGSVGTLLGQQHLLVAENKVTQSIYEP